jgi:hypothetical protein
VRVNGSLLKQRVFGRIDERGGEFAATSFFHIWFLPLFPTQSVWIFPEWDQLRALDTRWHPRSIVVAYARAWCPIIAAICLTNDSVASFCVAALAIAVWAMSWAWRMMPGAHAQRRSDLHLLALGTRCEPRRMSERTRAEVLAEVTRTWEAIANNRSPEDVARFGSARVDELIIAYGVLAMHAVTDPPDEAKPARKAAAGIALGHHDPVEFAGVFRSVDSGQPVIGRAELSKVVAERAAIAGHDQVLATERVPKSWVQRVVWGSLRERLFGYLLVGCGVIAGLGMLANVRDPDTLDFVQNQALANTIGTRRIDVRVACDSIERHRAAVPESAWLCHVGKKILPMVDLTEIPANRVVHGALVSRRPFGSFRDWEQLLQRGSHVDMWTYQVYLDTALRSKLGQIVLGATVLATALGLLALWEVQRRRRDRRLAAARRATSASP